MKGGMSILILGVFFQLARAAPTVSWDTYSMKVSETGPGNLLPQFRFMHAQVEGGSSTVPIGGGVPPANPFTPSDSCGEEIWNHASVDLSAPNMPHLTQDQWSCSRTPTNVSVIAYEDSFLKLSITPQWGARIWSVHDKRRNRDWTFNNPAHQPANIAVLKAWYVCPLHHALWA
jgi:hypothetical protein